MNGAFKLCVSVLENGDELEFLWTKFPDNAVWRRKDNSKWYGAILTVSRNKLGLSSNEVAEIIDLRLEKEQMSKTIDNEHYFPGWHMNKKRRQIMKRKWVKNIVSFLCSSLCTVILLMGVSVLKDGMYLLGVPAISEVQRAEISYPAVTDEIKEITDKEQIELAVKLTGFLKYSLFEEASLTEKPLITITYYLNNGESISVAANNKTVWWKGTAYAIKEEEMFVNMTQGIFFFDEFSIQNP